MPKDEKDQQTEQTPTGYTVPVPKRDEFFGNLKKAAKPDRDSASRLASDERKQGRFEEPKDNLE